MNEATIEEFRLKIEEDLEWRLDEIAFFANHINGFRLTGPSLAARKRLELTKAKYRKSLVLVLYSHFEGFFRHAMETYVKAVNHEKITAKEAIDVLLASSLNKEFTIYDADKNKLIYESDGLNKAVKKNQQRTLLIGEINKMLNSPLVLPIGPTSTKTQKWSVVYTESNLRFETIEKILTILGLNQKAFLKTKEFVSLRTSIDKFVKKRNGLAHGSNEQEFKDGITEIEYNNYRKVFEKITTIIPIIISYALKNKVYLKPEFRK